MLVHTTLWSIVEAILKYYWRVLNVVFNKSPISIISPIQNQCGGSGMFIPDPTFFHPGSELSPSRIPDPHQRI
jgi:hypothetical protein